MSKQLEIDRQVTMKDRLPYYILSNIQSHPSYIQLSLTNVGLPATDINFAHKTQDHYELELFDLKKINSSSIVIHVITPEEKQENIDFCIVYKSIYGNNFFQQIHKYPGRNFLLDPPSDPIHP